MKKTIITALFCATVSLGTAQRNSQNLDVNQKTEIAVKRLQLKLDLNNDQVKEISPLLREQVQFRKDIKNRNTDLSSYEKRIAVLDRKIEFQRAMQNILSENQYESWKKQQSKRRKSRRRFTRS